LAEAKREGAEAERDRARGRWDGVERRDTNLYEAVGGFRQALIDIRDDIRSINSTVMAIQKEQLDLTLNADRASKDHAALKARLDDLFRDLGRLRAEVRRKIAAKS
jgi:t-SNARE complex subunit (syntaxin)